jgi:hypothetical protein
VVEGDDDPFDLECLASTVFRLPPVEANQADIVESSGVVNSFDCDSPSYDSDGYPVIIDESGFDSVVDVEDSKDLGEISHPDSPRPPIDSSGVSASHNPNIGIVDVDHRSDIPISSRGTRVPPSVAGLQHLDDAESSRISSFMSDPISRRILNMEPVASSVLRSFYTALQDVLVGAAMYVLLCVSGTDLTGLWLCFWGWCSLSLMKWCAYGTHVQKKWVRPTRAIIIDWSRDAWSYLRAGFFNCVWIVSLWREWPNEYYVAFAACIAVPVGLYFIRSRPRIVDQAGFWERENHVRRTHLLQIILAILSLVSGAGFLLFNQVQPAFRVVGHVLGLINPATGCVNYNSKKCATRFDPHMKCNSCTEAEVTNAVVSSLPQDNEVKLNRAGLLLQHMIDTDGGIPKWFESLSSIQKELVLSNLHITLKDFEENHYAFEICAGRVCLAVPKHSDYTLNGVRSQYVRTPEGLHKIETDKELKPNKLHSLTGPVKRSDSPDWRKPIQFVPVRARKQSFANEEKEKPEVIAEVEGIINQIKDAKMSMKGIEVAESADGYLITVEAGTNIVLSEQIWWHKFVPRFLHNKIDHLLIVLVVALIAVFIYVFNVNRETDPVEVVEAVGAAAPVGVEVPPRNEATKVDPDVQRLVDSLVTKVSMLEVKADGPTCTVDETGDVQMAAVYSLEDEYGDKQSNKRKANVSRADVKSGVNLLRPEEDKTTKAQIKQTVERTGHQKSRNDKQKNGEWAVPAVQKSSFVFYQIEDIIKHLENHGSDSAFRGIVMFNAALGQKRAVKSRKEYDAALNEGFRIAPWLLPEDVTYLKVPMEKFGGKFPPVMISMLAKLGYLMRLEDKVENPNLWNNTIANIVLSKEELTVQSNLLEKLAGESERVFTDLVKRSNTYWAKDLLSPKHDFGPAYPFVNTRAAVNSAVKHPSEIVHSLESLRTKGAAKVQKDVAKVANEMKTTSTCTLVTSGFCKSEYCRVDHSVDGCFNDNGVWRKVTVVLPRPADAPAVIPLSTKVTKSKAKKKQAGSDPVVLKKLVDEANAATIRSDVCPYNPCTIFNCIKQHVDVVVADEKSKSGIVLDVPTKQVEASLGVLNESNISGKTNLTRTTGCFTLYCKKGLTADRRIDAIGQCWMGPHRLETVAHNFWDTNGVSRVLDFSDYYILGPDRTMHYAVPASVKRYKLENTDLVDDYASFEVDAVLMKALHTEVRYSLASPRLGGKYSMVVVHPSRGVLTLPVDVSSIDKRFLIRYSTDTEAGYSGAAIFDNDTGKVVARHKGFATSNKQNCAIGHSAPLIAMCGTVCSQMAAKLPKN